MHTQTFQALADPTRLSILEILRSGEQSVNDITDLVDIHQSGVSRHLHILFETGFVQVRPDGQKHFYSLRAERFREIDTWIGKYRSFWEARLDKFAEALNRRQKLRHSKRKEKPIDR
jgi:DNA-binding transcriptional ArsR family regulator